MSDKPVDSWRARAAVSEALDVFNSSYMQEVWTKALARREADPEGAVTSARTLLESVCKHILDDAEKEYREGLQLPQLYKLTAEVLDLAPNVHTAPIFTALFAACAEIVESIGRLRNHLSDSHGRGPFGTMPDWRHAELAVNLSAAMATYLSAVWAGRQPTVADVIRTHLAKTDATEPLGSSHRYTLERVTRADVGKVIASKLQTSDLMAHWETRRAKDAAPQTIMSDITYMRGALGPQREHVFDRFVAMLRAKKLVGKYIPRDRRLTHEEYDALIELFNAPPKKRVVGYIPMVGVMEFAVWSGRSISEICSLRWSDVDLEKKTCKLPKTGEEFPLLEGAWEIVRTRQRLRPSDPNERIFPYRSRSVSAKHTLAKKALQERVGKDLRFQDLRREAVSRLLEKGHLPHEVARATGQDIKKVNDMYKKLKSSAPLKV